MMTARFSIFESMRKATVELPDDIRLRIYDIILDYGFYGTEPEFEPEEYMLKGIFESMRYAIDQSIALSESGRKGGKTTKKETTPETTLATTLKSTLETNRIEKKRIEEEEKRIEKNKENPLTPLQGEPPELIETVESWLRYKKERRQEYKPTSLEKFVSMVKNKIKAHGVDAVVEVMNTSMSNNWQGVAWKMIKTQPRAAPTKNAPHGVDPITGIPYAN